MKIVIIYALTLVALVHGKAWMYGQESSYDGELQVGHDGIRKIRSPSKVKVCEAGETKMEDCNSCFCVVDGSGWACTKKGCETLVLQERERANPSEPQKICESGETKWDDCNRCVCTVNGDAWGCTRKLCEPPVHLNRDDAIKQTDEVDPSS